MLIGNSCAICELIGSYLLVINLIDSAVTEPHVSSIVSSYPETTQSSTILMMLLLLELVVLDSGLRSVSPTRDIKLLVSQNCFPHVHTQ